MDNNVHNQAMESHPSRKRWQYSLLTLLIVTTVVAICLAFGVHFPRFTALLLTLSVVQFAAMFLADWLIRPGSKSKLAAVAWSAIGSLFLLSGLSVAIETKGGITAWTLVVCLIAACIVCYGSAFRHWYGI
jgi:hypothetical protein